MSTMDFVRLTMFCIHYRLNYVLCKMFKINYGGLHYESVKYFLYTQQLTTSNVNSVLRLLFVNHGVSTQY